MIVKQEAVAVEEDFQLEAAKVIHNPDDGFFIEYLKPYYVVTRDGQYLFASTQPGRRPDRAFYMVSQGYRLGRRQQPFDVAIGHKLYQVVRRYLQTCQVIVQEGIQGEAGYEAGLRVILSVENPHTAYIAWMGRLMVFPPPPDLKIHCWNYIIQEPLPEEYLEEIREFWPQYDPWQPLTLYDLTEMDRDVRRVVSLGVDYFGGAYKKPNLTMVWNRAESQGLISYHAGCTRDRILKGLSGTGKTTLTVGPKLEQDDAVLGRPCYKDGRIVKLRIIGLEAASFAKSEGLTSQSPEYPGLMKSTQIGPDGKRPIVLALNIDCEGIEYRLETIAGHKAKVPRQIAGQEIGSLQCTRYQKSGTTNGRFIFQFSALNARWGTDYEKWLKTESLSFKRFDILEPIFRVTDPVMAAALDSACETIITSAISAQVPGTRVRSYAATDFMVREQSHQALAKWKMYHDLGLGLDGKLVFFIKNVGFVGECDLDGHQIRVLDENGQPIPRIDPLTGDLDRNELGEIRYLGQGEKIAVQDSKRLVDLVEHRRIERWIEHPVYGYLIPDPLELEEKHGMKNFRQRFNLLRFYTPEQIIEFIRRDIAERTEFLQNLFDGQEGEDELRPVIEIWKNKTIPSPAEIEAFYREHYGQPEPRN